MARKNRVRPAGPPALMEGLEGMPSMESDVRGD